MCFVYIEYYVGCSINKAAISFIFFQTNMQNDLKREKKKHYYKVEEECGKFFLEDEVVAL